MKWNDIPHGTMSAAQQRLWIAFGDNAGAIAERLKTDEQFALNLADLAKACLEGRLQTVRPKKADPIDELDRELVEEFNLDPERIASSLQTESKQLRVDTGAAMLHLMARLPIVVSRSLEVADRILKRPQS